MDFRNIYGHEQIVTHLRQAITEGKVSHAYILNGEDNSGKMMIAEAFAKTILCEGNEEDASGRLSCNLCKSCLQAESHNHPDIMYVTHQGASIGVDDIRTQVNSDIAIKPYSSNYKIYIIDEAEKMTEQAQNALLKTIEEPPEYAILILLVNNITTLLPTILSRCVKLTLRPVAKETIQRLLMEKYQVPDYLAQASAAFSGGNVGKSIQYATNETFSNMKQQVIELVDRAHAMQISDIIAALKQLSEDKSKVTDYLDLFIMWYRDILVYKATSEVSALFFREDAKIIMKHAEKLDYDQVEIIMEAIDKTKTRLKANVNFDIAMEMMLLTIKENEHD